MKPTLTLLSSLLLTLFIYNPLHAEVSCYYDYIAPVAICDAHTVVSLSNDGTARVYATDIDDGSYDNCHIAEYKVRRMVQGWCPPGIADDTQFRPYVEFCCEDVGQTIWVVMRVVDEHGNYNECMAEVIVQDNSSPHIVCPPNITVSCSYYFNDDCLYNPYNHTFGNCGGWGGNCSSIIINDPGNTSCNQPYNWGCDGYGGGSCGNNSQVNLVEVIDYRNSCGVGIIKRKFCVGSGYWSECCYQTITVKDFSHSYYNINWPWDYTADACQYTVDELDPEEIPPPYNKPTIPGYSGYGHSCSLIGIAHEDLVFTFNDGACKKILREWTVIDWCKYQPNNPWSAGIWKHTQVIKLMNSHAPYFVNYCPEHVVVNGYEPYCSGRYIDSPEVHDDCTPTDAFKWDWKIDLNNDGSYNISGEGSGQPHIDKVLPNGWHKILWNIGDACGNYATCSHKVHVIDKKAPSPVCYYGLSSVVMPLGGMVTIWAKDFNVSSYDNCTPDYKLKYSFSANIYEASRIFTCDDVGTVPVQIWVHDEYGNKDYCTTFIKITDNANTCVGNLVSGSVTTFGDIGVPQTSAAMSKIMPDQSLDIESNTTSDAQGHFALEFGTTQFDRMVMLSRAGKPLEGISTLDLIALKRHINGIEPITEPYKLYAADLDGSGRVGANDLLLLRNALFGAYQLPTYAGNLSWVFFGDPCSPETPEDLYNNYCHPGVEINHNGNFPATASFKAIKMGDVNGDMVNSAWLLTPRTTSTFELYVDENETNGVRDFILSKDAVLYGFQMSIQANGLNLTEGMIPVSGANLVVDQAGISRISWGQSEPVQLKKGDVLFSVSNLPAGLTPDKLLIIDEESLYPEIYTDKFQNQKIELVPFTTSKSLAQFETKVSPNPFSDNTTLSIIIPAEEEFLVSLYNMKGQELFNRKYISYTNSAEIIIGSDIIQTPGIYYYKVISILGELSGKFVKQ